MERRERKKDLSTNMNQKETMDSFLANLGLYRKRIAKDGSCLFRAVAEQVFSCQTEHLRVRKACIEYMKENKDKFEAFVEGPFDHHLFNLRSQKEWAGQVEIQALSLMYKCDFLVYKDVNAVPIKATENNYDKEIILCYSNGNHYDSIYPRSHENNLGLCQSIAFELLYDKVFPMLMMKDPENRATTPTDQNNRPNDFGGNILVNGYNGHGSENDEENDEGWTTVKSKKQGKMSAKNVKNLELCSVPLSPAPLSPASSKYHWEVMRSVDPVHYRNIELEVWEENRKEQQQKDQAVAANIQFKKGDRCQVKHPIGDKFYMAIIDDVFEDKCKIWIPELKERTVMPFARLKPKEQNSNSSYQDLSGFHRKENSQDNNNPRGDDQRSCRRRKSNRNRKGSANDMNEKNQQEVAIQEDVSGRQRGDKNRRRRNNVNPAKNKEDKKEVNEKEDGTVSKDQASAEVVAFPALPKKAVQTTMEKAKTDSENPDPATFWRKRREFEQMERTTVDAKKDAGFIDVVTESATFSPEDSSLNEESGNFHSVKDGIIENPFESVQEELPEEAPSHEIPQEIFQETAQELPQKMPQEISTRLVHNVSEVQAVTIEKRVNWKDLQNNEEKSPSYSINNESPNNYESMNVNVNSGKLESCEYERTTTPVHMTNTQPAKQHVIEIEEDKSTLEAQSYTPMNEVLHDPQRNFEILKNPARQTGQVEQLPPSTATSRYMQPEKEVLENGTSTEHGILEHNESSVVQMTNHGANATPLANNGNERHEVGENTVSSPSLTSDQVNPQPINAATIQNEILNGNITFSLDPEGKDLPKDVEIVRHFYNYGISMYQYFNGMSGVFPGNAPMSPVYPLIAPNTMYAMHQSYQNRAMMMPQNVYPHMQQQTVDENQLEQSPSNETQENGDSPGYKPSIPMHQSPQYHATHAMAGQQAMFNMNYGQMYATAGHRPYSNYNMFPAQRSPFRYPSNKTSFNRQAGGRKRYYRNDNQANVKLHNLQTGYGQYSKETE